MPFFDESRPFFGLIINQISHLTLETLQAQVMQHVPIKMSLHFHMGIGSDSLMDEELQRMVGQFLD